MFCSKCGAILKYDATFCEQCGAKISANRIDLIKQQSKKAKLKFTKKVKFVLILIAFIVGLLAKFLSILNLK